jgi:hypothetical protein
MAQALLRVICNESDEATHADPAEVTEPQARQIKCQVGDVEVKQRPARALNASLAPIRESPHGYKRGHGTPDDSSI